jgi:hypothetical protein
MWSIFPSHKKQTPKRKDKSKVGGTGWTSGGN